MRGITPSCSSVVAGPRRSGLARGAAALCVLALGCLLGGPAPAQPKGARGAHAPRPAIPPRQAVPPRQAEPPRAAEVPPPSEARAPVVPASRCTSTAAGDAPPPALCLRHVFGTVGQPLRVLSWSGAAADRAQVPTVELDGQVLAPLAPPPKSPPAPLSLMLMVQLPDGPLTPALRDSLRAVIDATFKHPKSSLGLLVYERGRRVLVEQELTDKRDEIGKALAQIESRTASSDGASFSFSEALRVSLKLIDNAPLAPNSQTVVLAIGSGFDDLATQPRNQFVESTIPRLVRQSVVLDSLFISPPGGGRAPKYLQELVGQSGGRLLSTAALDELPSKTGEYLSQVLDAVQTTHYALPAGLSAGPRSYRLTVRAAGGGATIGLGVELAARGAAEAAVQKPGGEAPTGKLATRSFSHSPLWWWLDGGLLALVLGALCVPAWRRRVQAALFGESPLLPPLPRREATTGGGGVLTEPLPRVAVTPRAPTVGRAVEWVEAFRSPRGQTHVAWLLSSATGRVYFLEKADTILGGDLGCDIFIGSAGGSPAAVGSALAQTLTPGVSPRCRLVRDAGSGQLLVYPVDGMTVDRNGQRLNSPTYVFDQDELQIGASRFRYFETRTSMTSGNN